MPYIPLIEAALPALVEKTVPSSTKGYINLKSTRDILQSWRTQRVLDPGVVDGVLRALEQQTFAPSPGTDAQAQAQGTPAPADGHGENGDGNNGSGSKRQRESMKRKDVLNRIEEDRERQKRLREKRWILPIPAPGADVNPADVEFDLMWDNTAELDEDDRERMRADLATAGLADRPPLVY